MSLLFTTSLRTMSSSSGKVHLDNSLPTGVHGSFSIKKTTHTGGVSTTQIRSSNNHTIEISIVNHSRFPVAVKFEIEFKDKKVEFAKSNDHKYIHSELLWPPAGGFSTSHTIDKRKKIKPGNHGGSDQIQLRLDCHRLFVSSNPTVEESIQLKIK